MGTSATLNCTVQITPTGVPITVNARWRRNNAVINSSTPHHTLLETISESGELKITGLRVDDTTLDDDGAVYTCTADGAPGNFNSSVMLNVTGGKYTCILTQEIFINLILYMYVCMYNLTVVTVSTVKL